MTSPIPPVAVLNDLSADMPLPDSPVGNRQTCPDRYHRPDHRQI